MTKVSPAEMKRHCQADDFDDDDDLLVDLQANAEAYVQGIVRRDLDVEGWPKACNGAVKMLTAFWYDTRHGGGGWDGVRSAVSDMLSGERNLS